MFFTLVVLERSYLQRSRLLQSYLPIVYYILSLPKFLSGINVASAAEPLILL